MINFTTRVLNQSELARTASKEGNRRKERTNKKNCIWDEKDDGLFRGFGRSYMEHFAWI